MYNYFGYFEQKKNAFRMLSRLVHQVTMTDVKMLQLIVRSFLLSMIRTVHIMSLTIDSVLFHEALSCLMSNEAWPMGMLVRRLLIKRTMETINNDITICTFNCRGIKSSLSEVWQLCDMYDVVFWSKQRMAYGRIRSSNVQSVVWTYILTASVILYS